MKYTIEQHGDGYAIYFGRDWQHHGANIGHLTEVTPETIKLIEDALNATLAQTEQDDEAYGYAKYLAECIWKKHYKEESPHWRPSDNTLSVLTQIDNMTCGLEKAQPDTTPHSATRSADSAESFCKQELHNLMSVAGRMALELECLLLDTENLSVVSKWWDTGMEALQAYRHYVWSVTHGKDGENFCDTHCVHTDHHPDCELAQPEQVGFNGLTESETEQTMSVKGLSTEQRPLYFRNKETGEMCTGGFLAKHIDRWQPLYGEPPKREFVGLTDEEIRDIHWSKPMDEYSYARAIEAKLKEKNT